MSDAIVRRHDGNFHWDGVDVLAYKQDGAAPFKDVTRQVLFDGAGIPGQLRYFEVAPGGYSTLERHEHMHAVVIIPRPRAVSGWRRGVRAEHARSRHRAADDLASVPGRRR
jgi:hypothetical protein